MNDRDDQALEQIVLEPLQLMKRGCTSKEYNALLRYVKYLDKNKYYVAHNVLYSDNQWSHTVISQKLSNYIFNHYSKDKTDPAAIEEWVNSTYHGVTSRQGTTSMPIKAVPWNVNLATTDTPIDITDKNTRIALEKDVTAGMYEAYSVFSNSTEGMRTWYPTIWMDFANETPLNSEYANVAKISMDLLGRQQDVEKFMELPDVYVTKLVQNVHMASDKFTVFYPRIYSDATLEKISPDPSLRPGLNTLLSDQQNLVNFNNAYWGYSMMESNTNIDNNGNVVHSSSVDYADRCKRPYEGTATVQVYINDDRLKEAWSHNNPDERYYHIEFIMDFQLAKMFNHLHLSPAELIEYRRKSTPEGVRQYIRTPLPTVGELIEIIDYIKTGKITRKNFKYFFSDFFEDFSRKFSKK